MQFAVPPEANNMRKFIFEAAEYQDRLLRTKQQMARDGIEVLIVVDPANMNYLTGYDGWSFYVNQGVVINLDSDEPAWFGREQDAAGARLTTWLSDENIWPYPDDYVQFFDLHPMSFVADRLRERGWQRRTIGVEMDNYWFTARCLQRLTAGLPDASIKDATCLVNWIRVIKSPMEIRYIREAARIVERVMDVAVNTIRPGVWEKAAAADVVHAQFFGTEEYGGEAPSINVIMPSAERTAAAHLTYDPDRVYQPGDHVLLELAGCRYRYHAPLSRTVFLGAEPPEKLRHIANVVVEGLQRSLEFIRPGITAGEVARRWLRALEGTGVEKPSRVGYSFGVNYVPDWGEHTISLRPIDQTVLQPGMTIHFMPGIWEGDTGFECSEPILITETGCEKLVEFPQRLFVSG